MSRNGPHRLVGDSWGRDGALCRRACSHLNRRDFRWVLWPLLVAAFLLVTVLSNVWAGQDAFGALDENDVADNPTP